MHQKWPDTISPMVNFVFPLRSLWSGGGGGVPRGGSPRSSCGDLYLCAFLLLVCPKAGPLGSCTAAAWGLSRALSSGCQRLVKSFSRACQGLVKGSVKGSVKGLSRACQPPPPGVGGVVWGPHQPRPTQPPTQINKIFLRQKMKFIKGTGNLRPILRT